MRTISALVATLLLCFAPACGGSKQPAAGGGPVTGTPPKTGEAAEHGDLPPAVNAFHEVLAPLWHADPGDKRTDDTCAALEELRQHAADIVVAETPASASADQAGYRDAASALVHAVVELGEACAAAGRAKFTERFADVHTTFHTVMELASSH